MAKSIVNPTVNSTVNLTVNPNDQWLIKSAGRIMGPFKLTEVTAGLHLKHFTVLDEISLPYGRWVMIRDEAALQESIKDVRKKEDFIESTVTQTENLNKIHTITANYVNMNEEPPEGGPGSPPPMSREQRIRRDIQLSADPQVRATAKRQTLVLPVFIAIMVLVFSGGAYFFFNKKGSGAGSPTEALMLQALSYKSQGLFEKSIDILNRIKIADKGLLEAEVEAAFIQIGMYSQTLIGRRTLEKLSSKFSDSKYGPQIYTSLGLSYLLEGDWKNADENLQKALKLDPQFVSALHNKGVLSFRSGQYEKAEKDFETIISSNPNNPYILIGSALSSLEVYRKGGSPVRIMPVLIQLLDSYLKENFDLEQEILLIQSYIYTQINNTKARATIITRILSGDLDSGRNHKFDILTDKSVVGWKNLLPYCQAVYESAPRDPLNKSLWAYCLFRSGNDMESKKLSYEVVVENPTHSQSSYVKSYLMNILQQPAEAKVTLNAALSDKNNKGAYLLKAIFCEQDRNEVCVLDTLSQLLDADPRLINAYVGLAKLDIRKGNRKGALEWVNRGMGLTSTYIPLLELKNSLVP